MVTNFSLEYGIPTIRTQHSVEVFKFSKQTSNERTNLMNGKLDIHPNFALYFPTPTPVEQLEQPQGFSSSFPQPKHSHRLSYELPRPRQSNQLSHDLPRNSHRLSCDFPMTAPIVENSYQELL